MKQRVRKTDLGPDIGNVVPPVCVGCTYGLESR